jgi:hypothetical protein
VRFAIRLLRDWRLTVAWGKSLLRSGLTSFVVLAVTFWLLPGVRASGGPAALVELTILLALIGTVMRLVLLGVAVVVGGIGVLALGVVIQAVVMFTALRVATGVSVDSFADAWVASWVAAVLAALVNWLADAGSEDVFLGQALRQMARRHRGTPASEPGVLVVQLDGLSAPLLSWAVKAGNLPNLGKWVRTGTHGILPWHTGMPATTPASQAGIMHGSFTQIPAFRWYEKDAARLIVTNRPRDAAEVEARLTDGRGLLADGGVSISNVFSGDAPTSLLTFSNAGLPGRSARGYLAFVASPYGFARALVLSVGEMLKEIQQARRQRFRNVYPRVPRTGAYVVLRAISNVLLRDLNVSLIAEQMSRGAPVIYCDFVDYDEVAHHAGPTRPESLQTLEGLDRVLGALQRIIDLLPHSYEIVVLSDHGQSQGSTFLQRYGRTLTQVVDDLVDTTKAPVAATGRSEGWGPVNAFLTELSLRASVGGKVTRKALHGKAPRGEVELGPADCEPPVAADEQMIVTASGNLALIYLARTPGRVPLEEIELLHPRLIPGLAMHPGIGFVVVDTLADGPVAVGRAGVRVLRSGRVEGADPLEPYGPQAGASMLRQAEMPHNGDIVVISRLDEYTHEVAAFEELVGCHGGIGGWQTEAVLVHPRRWVVDEPPVGSDAVHHLLISWLDQLGQRKSEEARLASSSDASVEA